MELPGQADIGSKVSIRLHINHQNSDQREDPIDALFTDILGTLETPTSIRKKNGELVTFDPTEIALWKVVPSTSQQTGIALYNTQTRRIDPLMAEIGKRVHIYCCGPTVYRDAHVGNLRTFLLPDLISRILRFDGWHPVVVQNITDVGHMNENFEDKLLEEATRERRNPIDIARDYEARFFTDLDRLNIAPADRSPRASDSIPLMQEMISRLIENGVAYVGDDSSVYFSAETFESYGAISGNRLDSLKPGHRYEYTDDGDKRFHADWALWKNAGTRTDMVWDSPWGSGFPGWHIECTAMSMEYLDSRVALHIGGIDLRFPHHENERAQSNSIAHREVVAMWLHGEHLLFEGRKMAKSSGNVILVKDIIDRGYDPLALRLALLESKYRNQLDLSWDSLRAADKTLKRWRLRVSEWMAAPAVEKVDISTDIEDYMSLIRNDLDFPRALVKLRALEKNGEVAPRIKAEIFITLDEILGLKLQSH